MSSILCVRVRVRVKINQTRERSFGLLSVFWGWKVWYLCSQTRRVGVGTPLRLETAPILCRLLNFFWFIYLFELFLSRFIELFHIFKSQLNVDELISYMRNLLVCQENIYLTDYYWLKIIKKDEDIIYNFSYKS